MRARGNLLATSRASAAAPASFEDTLFQVSMKTQQRNAQARSLEPLPRSSVSLGIDQRHERLRTWEEAQEKKTEMIEKNDEEEQQKREHMKRTQKTFRSERFKE
jgi:hypothetical protein